MAEREEESHAKRLLATEDTTTANPVSMREYYNKLALVHALDCVMAGEVDAGRRFLALSRSTVWHRRRWRMASALAALPAPVREAAITMWRAAKR